MKHPAPLLRISITGHAAWDDSLMAPTARTATVRGVRILRVGTWPASTGPATFTAQDLADVVRYQHDPHAAISPIKMGHRDKIRNAALSDGTPAFGRVTNLRLVEDGKAVDADLEHVPVALAEIMKSAYPFRSPEVYRNVATESGNTYTARLAALSLLGVDEPAQDGLGDIGEIIYGADVAAARGETTGELVRLTWGDGSVMPDIEPDVSHTGDVAQPPADGGNMTVDLTKLLGLAPDASAEVQLEAVTALLLSKGEEAKPDPKPEVKPPAADGTLTVTPEMLAALTARLTAAESKLAEKDAVIVELAKKDGEREVAEILSAGVEARKFLRDDQMYKTVAAQLSSGKPGAIDAAKAWIEALPAMFKTEAEGYEGIEALGSDQFDDDVYKGVMAQLGEVR